MTDIKSNNPHLTGGKKAILLQLQSSAALSMENGRLDWFQLGKICQDRTGLEGLRESSSLKVW